VGRVPAGQGFRRGVGPPKRLRGGLREYLTAARDHAASNHPQVIARQDALLLGIYRMMRQLVPAPPPDVCDLGTDYLDDLVNLGVKD
jgi:hypothetical protein